MLKPIHISEGLRMFRRRIKVAFSGTKKYDGNAKEICRQIIKDCWNGTYFQASAGHFSEFWTRDFGMCADSLIKLGYKKKVIKTLKYALGIFYKDKAITTTISPYNKPFDFPYYSVDSLPFFLRSLRTARANGLIKKYRKFLNHEILKFYSIVTDKRTGLVKKNAVFSSMKDYFFILSRFSALFQRLP